MQIGDSVTAAAEEEHDVKLVYEVVGAASLDRQVVDPVALVGAFADLQSFEHPLEGMVKIHFHLYGKINYK